MKIFEPHGKEISSGATPTFSERRDEVPSGVKRSFVRSRWRERDCVRLADI